MVLIAAVELFSRDVSLDIVKEHVCDIVRFSGDKVSIDQTVELSFKIGPCVVRKLHKFAVVGDNVFPFCFL